MAHLKKFDILYYQCHNHLIEETTAIAPMEEWEDAFLGSCRDFVKWNIKGTVSADLRQKLYPKERMIPSEKSANARDLISNDVLKIEKNKIRQKEMREKGGGLDIDGI